MRASAEFWIEEERARADAAEEENDRLREMLAAATRHTGLTTVRTEVTGRVLVITAPTAGIEDRVAEAVACLLMKGAV